MKDMKGSDNIRGNQAASSGEQLNKHKVCTGNGYRLNRTVSLFSGSYLISCVVFGHRTPYKAWVWVNMCLCACFLFGGGLTEEEEGGSVIC